MQLHLNLNRGNLLLLLFTKLDKFTCVQLEEFGKYLTNLVYLNVIRDY